MLTKIDHLVYTAPNLEEGITAIEQLTGVRPVMGGRHPSFGTHNALVSLGPKTYLEIVTADPGLEAPFRGRWLQACYDQAPGLATWVYRTEQIRIDAQKALDKGISIGPIEKGKRLRPDGTLLTWELTDPYAMPLQGAFPFLISWGDTPHPATTSPQAGELVDLKVYHPDPQLVRDQLAVLDMELEVLERATVGFAAFIETSNGLVNLI